MAGLTSEFAESVWPELLDALDDMYLQEVSTFLDAAYRRGGTRPPRPDVFNAFSMTPFEKVKVVILGQDPYPREGDAMGLAFSARDRVPRALGRVFDELADDPGISFVRPGTGDLSCWARQGVLLLNRVLTRGESRSHRGGVWERFTDTAIELLNARETPVAFLLWGKAVAWEKAEAIRQPHHFLRLACHPAARAGNRFVGCRHFSQVNWFLGHVGSTPIAWDCLTEDRL